VLDSSLWPVKENQMNKDTVEEQVLNKSVLVGTENTYLRFKSENVGQATKVQGTTRFHFIGN